MKHISFSALTAALIAIVATSAYASTQSGKISYIYVRASDGLIYFELEGSRNAKPACATNNNYFIIKAENSAAGRQQYAMLLAAKAASKAVTVRGANQCTRWSDGEDVEDIGLVE